MGEINTRGMVRLKAPGFPAGNDNECLSKSEILVSYFTKVGGNYGANECPLIDDITLNIPKGLSLGYLDTNGNAIPVMSFVDGGTCDGDYYAQIVGDNISIIILNGFYDRYNRSYADAVKLTVEGSVKQGDMFLKMPGYANGVNGSIIFEPARKIGEGIFYIGTPFPAKVPIGYTYRIRIDGATIDEYALYPLSFTYTIERKS